MILCVILFIIGGICVIKGITVDPISAVQQTVQWLMFICGSILVSSGIIYIIIYEFIKVINKKKDLFLNKSDRITHTSVSENTNSKTISSKSM